MDHVISLTLFRPVRCALRFSSCLQMICMLFWEYSNTACLLQYQVSIFSRFGRGPYRLVIAMFVVDPALTADGV